MCIIQINFTFVWNKYYNIIMLSIAERHKHILDKLNAQGFVKVLDIARELDVTPVTIRKDLKLLEEKKLLFRTHGSASPVNPHTADINIHIKEPNGVSPIQPFVCSIRTTRLSSPREAQCMHSPKKLQTI